MAPSVNMDMDWRDQQAVKVNGVWTVSGRPTNQVAVSWNETPSTVPGKAYIGLKVTSPVNGATPPHRHGDAVVAATVIQGRVVNQMVCADGHVVGPKIYEKGDSWLEPPGCHHVRCENAGDEEAVFIAACILDEQLVKQRGIVDALVQIDAEMEERAKNAAA